MHGNSAASGIMPWASASRNREPGEVQVKFLDSLFGKKKDAPAEFDNAALVRAMHEVAVGDSPDKRRKLYETLLTSMLLIPVPELPQGASPGIHTLKTEMQVQIIKKTGADQVHYTVAFTDLEALRNWDPNTPYLGLRAVDLFRLVLNTDIQDIVVNPFDPIRKMIRPGGRIKRGEIEQLAKGNVPANARNQQFRLQANEQVFIGRPANPPSPAIQEALRIKASGIPAIAELHFFQMATKQGRSSTVIGITLSADVPENRRQEITQELGASFKSEMKPGEFLDFMSLSGSFGEQIRNLGGLIFRRS